MSSGATHTVAIAPVHSKEAVDVTALRPTSDEALPDKPVRYAHGGSSASGHNPEARPGEISSAMLGPPINLLTDSLPDWRWEHEAGQWRSYPLDDAVRLDHYWQAYVGLQARGEAEPHLARLRLLRREAIVDFVAMTCQVGGGRPRGLERRIREVGWLSNIYFFEAFKDAMGTAGVDVESSAEEMFDFRYNQDFRTMHDDGRALFRGGQPYTLPIGWMRFAVNVRGQYDQANNQWLKEDETGWAVAYHGTAGESLPGILCSGFRVGSRQKFEKETGAGIYCTPWIGVAQHYSRPKEMGGHSVQIVLQLRVKPSAIRPITSSTATEFEKKYWVINDPADIRAYGVLLRELPLEDYVPPEVMVFGKDWDKK